VFPVEAIHAVVIEIGNGLTVPEVENGVFIAVCINVRNGSSSRIVKIETLCFRKSVGRPNLLVAIYLDEQDYGKAKTVAERARKAGKTMAPEYRDKLNGY
jgi:hypothetical protein